MRVRYLKGTNYLFKKTLIAAFIINSKILCYTEKKNILFSIRLFSAHKSWNEIVEN